MDDDQQFCLRWNNHQSTLVSVFDTLLEKGMHVDCTLAAEGQTLKAHKVVLSACSPYFESVLSQQYDKHPIIILKDVKYAELRAMMDYMYRGEVNISQDQLAALLKAAESLQIKGLSDNKPTRPPSRPPPALPALPAHTAHPPRASSPPPQVRDGSVESREGSVSPTRRRKKARRMSAELQAAAAAAAAALPGSEGTGGGGDTCDLPLCKEESNRDGVEDLTLDEEPDDQPPPAHNDVVRNFQWHMERSQDEIMNSSDSVRESQEIIALTNETFAKRSFPITRGYLRSIQIDTKKPKKKTKPRVSKKRGVGTAQQYDQKQKRVTEERYCCSICKKKHYKYRRNKVRHERYECVTGPQFGCEICGKKYSQKKTLSSHFNQKHVETLQDIGIPI